MQDSGCPSSMKRTKKLAKKSTKVGKITPIYRLQQQFPL
jgi:hypothetical protein